ncbi:T9SS type A sorting domain-containing protein [uncultured Porphyromonas sp.]|uniref:InlB B-repeat-containing protein n=1 Tax=uncultured Porphyromonas sp. TaxID=159274 RepID=UPI00261DC9FB|nr:T9SS type A sorting domain-containing protein [uncultured Porphyromonas sp.]
MTRRLHRWACVLLCTLLTSIGLQAEVTPSITNLPSESLRTGSDGVITMTTSKAVGETIRLVIGTKDKSNVTVEGLQKIGPYGQYTQYTITSQTFTIKGNVRLLQCDNNQLTSLDVSQAVALTSLSCSDNELSNLDLSQNTALYELWCTGNQLTSLNVSKHTALKRLVCYKNQLTNLTLSSNTALEEIQCSENQLTSLDVSQAVALTTLHCTENKLSNLDLSQNTALKRLYCEGNQLTSLDVSQCTALQEIWCKSNKLTSLDLSQCTALQNLQCAWNQLTSLNVSQCTALKEIRCTSNKLTSLNLSQSSALQTLYCERNQLTSLVLPPNSALQTLYCERNQLTSLDLSQSTALEKLTCTDNKLTSLDLPQSSDKLSEIDCSDNQLISLNLSNLQELKKLKCFRNRLTSLTISNCDKLEYIACYSNQIKGQQMTALVNALPIKPEGRAGSLVVARFDPTPTNLCLKTDVAIANTKNWEVKKVGKYDWKEEYYEGEDDPLAFVGDGVITMTTTRQVGEQLLLSLSAPAGERVIAEGLKEPLILDGEPHFYTLTSQTVTLKGNLKLLNCGLYQSAFTHKNQLTSLNMSDCNTLRELYCLGNSLQSLDVSGCNTLEWLNCTENLLQSLDVSGCNTLKSLNCGQNLLQSLDITHNEALTDLSCYNNQLETLDLSHARALNFLYVSNNRLTDIDLSQCLNLQDVDLDKNQLTSLDVSHNLNLRRLLCSRNPIEGERMTQLVKTLSDRTGLAQGIFIPGKCLKSDVAIAKAKNWSAQDRKGNLYEGEDPITYIVTLSKEGEGTLTVTGADNLTAVPNGTELTIVATPAEGYELTALTANGEDILATKKFVVKEATEVKATFTKKSFAVTLTKEGEGTLTATGADDLTAVPYGTELTIAATPSEGYELTALTANGEDILATKKFVVKGATEVKATFTKMAFAVTLTSNEHGTISIVENVDLKAVPYGTTLTIKVEGKNDKCELTALTANGEDILATKKFVVKGATEVKATFVDHTGVETTVTQQTQLYPNPATDYVIVEGIAPASEVTLHSMTGELLCAMQADAEGHLQIDLTALSDGVYLLVGTGWQERLVVKK